MPKVAVVHSFGPHFGEEDCLRGWSGSGTIFFSWCNLRCVFCQNWEISQKGEDEAVSDQRLAGMMLELQGIGCHNINLMDQYRPCYRAEEAPGLDRRITAAEYAEARDLARRHGLMRLDGRQRVGRREGW